MLSRTILAMLSACSVVISFGAALLSGQSETLPAFEVASIKPHAVGGIVHHPSWYPTFQCGPAPECGVTGHRFREGSVGLAELIIDAYQVKKFQIAGLPNWGDSGHDLYDVEATIPDSVAPTPDNARLMLRTLLADRFHLRVYREPRLLAVYALVISKKGLKLVPGQKDCFRIPGETRVRRNGGRPDAQSPWAFYVQSLSIFTDRPVIDQSGLDGAGYCTSDGEDPLLSIGMEGGSRRPNEGWVYPVIEEKWGMKLEPKKALVDVLVVDKVERPSGN